MINFIYNKSPIQKIYFSILLSLCALFLQMKMNLYVDDSFFLLLYPVLVFICVVAGFVPAIVTVLFSSLISPYFFYRAGLTSSAIIQILTYALIGFSMALIIKYTSQKDLKTAKEELRNNEEKFENLANNISQHSWISDGDGWILWCNQRLLDYTGIPLERMRGRDWIEIHHPDHVERISESFKKNVDSGGHPWEEIYPIRGKDGVFRWFLSRSTPIKDKDGKIIQWFGTNTDIDKQVKIEEMLNASQTSFKQLANSIPHIIWTSQADGHFDFYNDRFYEFTGVEKNEVIDQTWESIVHPDDYQQQLINWSYSLQTGNAYQYEVRLKDRLKGGYRWFLELALPIKDGNGEVVKWYGSCTDIDAQKHLSVQIELQKVELENALIARDEFLTIASHELKTPLTALKLHAQIFNRARNLGRTLDDSEDRINLFSARIEKQVLKLNRLVDDMLDVSRIQSGHLTLKPQQFELCELVTEVFSILEEQFSKSNIPLPVFVSNQEEVMVHWNRERIEQVLINILTNSVRYGNGKQAFLNLEIDENKAFFVLKDQGIGIAKENMEKIFHRFEKIKNPVEVNGLGLGLFISKQIIEAHGGKIWVESELGIGSEFKINLPFKFLK